MPAEALAPDLLPHYMLEHDLLSSGLKTMDHSAVPKMAMLVTSPPTGVQAMRVAIHLPPVSTGIW